MKMESVVVSGFWDWLEYVSDDDKVLDDGVLLLELIASWD